MQPPEPNPLREFVTHPDIGDYEFLNQRMKEWGDIWNYIPEDLGLHDFIPTKKNIKDLQQAYNTDQANSVLNDFLCGHIIGIIFENTPTGKCKLLTKKENASNVTLPKSATYFDILMAVHKHFEHILSGASLPLIAPLTIGLGYPKDTNKTVFQNLCFLIVSLIARLHEVNVELFLTDLPPDQQYVIPVEMSPRTNVEKWWMTTKYATRYVETSEYLVLIPTSINTKRRIKGENVLFIGPSPVLTQISFYARMNSHKLIRAAKYGVVAPFFTKLEHFTQYLVDVYNQICHNIGPPKMLPFTKQRITAFIAPKNRALPLYQNDTQMASNIIIESHDIWTADQNINAETTEVIIDPSTAVDINSPITVLIGWDDFLKLYPNKTSIANLIQIKILKLVKPKTLLENVEVFVHAFREEKKLVGTRWQVDYGDPIENCFDPDFSSVFVDQWLRSGNQGMTFTGGTLKVMNSKMLTELERTTIQMDLEEVSLDELPNLQVIKTEELLKRWYFAKDPKKHCYIVITTEEEEVSFGEERFIIPESIYQASRKYHYSAPFFSLIASLPISPYYLPLMSASTVAEYTSATYNAFWEKPPLTSGICIKLE